MRPDEPKGEDVQVVRFVREVPAANRESFGHSAAELRGRPRRPGSLCARIEGAACRVQSRQCPGPRAAPSGCRRLDQSAAGAAVDERARFGLRVAVHARSAPELCRRAHPGLRDDRFSIAIQRGCFGGCTFCSITEHEGRIIQNRSESSVLREWRRFATACRLHGSDLGSRRATANMYRLACKSKSIEAACRRPSCVYPRICPNLNTDHKPLVQLYRKARECRG